MAKWQCKRDVVGVVVVDDVSQCKVPATHRPLHSGIVVLDSAQSDIIDAILLTDSIFSLCSYLVHVMTECIYGISFAIYSNLLHSKIGVVRHPFCQVVDIMRVSIPFANCAIAYRYMRCVWRGL